MFDVPEAEKIRMSSESGWQNVQQSNLEYIGPKVEDGTQAIAILRSIDGNDEQGQLASA